jgi:rhodanese-related sulfurtransferase
VIAEAVNIPLHELRNRMGELPRDRPVDVYCAVGQRGHYAVRLLRQHGFDARNLAGGWQTYCTL